MSKVSVCSTKVLECEVWSYCLFFLYSVFIVVYFGHVPFMLKLQMILCSPSLPLSYAYTIWGPCLKVELPSTYYKCIPSVLRPLVLPVFWTLSQPSPVNCYELGPLTSVVHFVLQSTIYTSHYYKGVLRTAKYYTALLRIYYKDPTTAYYNGTTAHYKKLYSVLLQRAIIIK